MTDETGMGFAPILRNPLPASSVTGFRPAVCPQLPGQGLPTYSHDIFHYIA